MTETKIPGPEKRNVSFKTGKGFTWAGMKPDVESVDAPSNVSRQLINMRFRGGRLEGRGGQILIAQHSLPITGLADYFTEVIENAETAPVTPGPGVQDSYLVATFDDSLGVALSLAIFNGASNGYFDDTMNPDGRMVTAYNGGMAYYRDGSVYFAADQATTATLLFAVPNGASIRHLTRITDAGGEKLIFSTSDDYVYNWDGAQLNQELTPPSAPTAYWEFGVGSATTVLSCYNGVMSRDWSGTWSALATSPEDGITAAGNIGADVLYYFYGIESGSNLDGTASINIYSWAVGNPSLTNINSSTTMEPNPGDPIIGSFYGLGPANLSFAWKDDSTGKIWHGAYENETTWNPTQLELTSATEFTAINGLTAESLGTLATAGPIALTGAFFHDRLAGIDYVGITVPDWTDTSVILSIPLFASDFTNVTAFVFPSANNDNSANPSTMITKIRSYNEQIGA